MTLIRFLYTFAMMALALYGAHVLILVIQYLRSRRERGVALPDARGSPLPIVTVQVPLYNERSVAERCIDAVAALDWPRDRLQIQVLDDSTDDTTAIARARVEAHRRRGIDIALLHRPHRRGYKGGALAAGMRSARGAFVAIFDADFVPAPDFLKRVLPRFADPSIGFVQTRWAHLNGPGSALASALALVVDGHFVVEQFARDRLGWPMIFNGSAGVWRAACIRACGGWQTDTLNEDMDLSLRATLAGWRSAFLPEVAVPQEEPTSLGAAKLQHARWAKGSAQCLRKHAASIITSRRWSAAQKLAGLMVLSGYVTHLLALAMVLMWLPLAVEGRWLGQLPMTLAGLCSLSLPLEFVLAQWSLHRADGSWLRALGRFPLLLVIGLGLTLSNALGTLSGLCASGGEWHPTPKGEPGEAVSSVHVARSAATAWLEISLSLYASIAAIAIGATQSLASALLMLLYAAGLGGVGLGSLIEGARAARWPNRAGTRSIRRADGTARIK